MAEELEEFAEILSLPRKRKKRKRKNKKEKESDLEVAESGEQANKGSDTVANQIYSIFLSGLPYETTEEDIKTFIFPIEDVIQIKLPKYQDTGRCLGYAHVEFQTEASMIEALKKNKEKIGKRYIDISKSKGEKSLMRIADQKIPSGCRSIFVKGLPYKISEDEVGDAFKFCGSIENVRMIYHGSTGFFKGFCYIDFEHTDSMKKALEMNGKIIQGRKIFVDYEMGMAKKGFKMNMKDEGNLTYSHAQKEVKKQIGKKHRKQETENAILEATKSSKKRKLF